MAEALRFKSKFYLSCVSSNKLLNLILSLRRHWSQTSMGKKSYPLQSAFIFWILSSPILASQSKVLITLEGWMQSLHYPFFGFHSRTIGSTLEKTLLHQGPPGCWNDQPENFLRCKTKMISILTSAYGCGVSMAWHYRKYDTKIISPQA